MPIHRRLLILAGAIATAVMITGPLSTSSALVERSERPVGVDSRPTPLVPYVCPTPAPAVPQVTLDPSMRISGSQVKDVQLALGIAADGVYGSVTATAVAAVVAPVDGCSVTPEVQVKLTALDQLVAVQDDLTAQAQTRRTVVGSSPQRGSCNGNFECFKPCTIAIEAPGDTYTTNTGNGYFGAFQFSQSTWNGAVERAGFPEWVGRPPSDAPANIQDAAAAQLYAERGNQPWGGRC